MSSVDRASVLAASPLFDWAQPEIVAQIAESFTVEKFGAQEMLCKQGEVGDKVFVIAEGSVDVVVFVGGVVPVQDYPMLTAAGVAGIYGPGTAIPVCAADVLAKIRARASSVKS